MYLNDLFVLKAYRQRRGAALLMEKFQEIASEENCGRIEGVMLADNEEALRPRPDLPFEISVAMTLWRRL
ncbi:GNAT family N-acetyltransferase [Legionella jordanis]|uniref:GNAT family N-acetyltransferase n=1 Tax=Legionella jordanis TaxID=456 RepID=UPI000EFDA397|nr:GNAT family N-acetyltransferase [Legionella jordanis]RMW99318.1 hypothetical protein EAW55_14025 [Legionella jordanis]